MILTANYMYISSKGRSRNLPFQVNLTLVYRDRQIMRLRTPAGDIEEFEILLIFPFTSESKRMGIIVRDTASGEISFVMKGADVVMANIGGNFCFNCILIPRNMR